MAKKETAVMDVELDTDPADDSLEAQVQALTAQVQALMAAQSGGGGLTEDRLEKILLKVAQVQADAAERAANPSNKTHPAISVYSFPEGDRARPRPALKCEMFWIGYPLEHDTTTAEEIDLLNRAEPGTYQFKRTDKSPETLTITGERAPNGDLSKLMFSFVTHERRDTLPAMADMLRSAFGVKTPEQEELDRLRAEVAALQKGQR